MTLALRKWRPENSQFKVILEYKSLRLAERRGSLPLNKKQKQTKNQPANKTTTKQNKKLLY